MDYDAAWLRWDFKRHLFLGGSEWRYAAPGKPQSALRRMAATTWGVNVWYNLQQGLIERPVAWMFAREQRRRVRRGEEPLDPSGRLAAGLMTNLKMDAFNVVGMVFVYLIWAIMVRESQG